MDSKVAVQDLKIGMFVADLDRPWMDTPFLLQGFLVEEDQQLRQLRRHCQFVTVDWARSVGEHFRGDPQAAPAERPSPARVVAPPPARAPDDELHFEGGRRFFDRVLESLRGLRDRQAGGILAAPDEAPAPERPAFLPPSMLLTPYTDAKTVEEEVAPAREAYAKTAEIVDKLASDVWDGKPVAFESVDDVVNEVVDSMVRNPDALMWVAQLRQHDAETYGHSLMVAVYLVAFGRHLGFPHEQLAHLGSIGLLLDIGKLRLPPALVHKQGRLTSGEFEMVKAHVAYSLDILEATPIWPDEVLEGIAQHHERMNGSGYPRGLEGDQIGLFGRMAGIADCFAALTRSRPYADAVSSYEALRSITGWGGEYFHEPLTEQFVQSISVFPVGSLIELSSGEVAVVVSHNKVRRLKPRVLLLTDPDKTPSANPVMVDLLYEPKLGGDKPAFIKRSLPAGAFGLDPREYYLS